MKRNLGLWLFILSAIISSWYLETRILFYTLKIEAQTANIEAVLRDADSLDPMQLIEARKLPKW